MLNLGFDAVLNVMEKYIMEYVIAGDYIIDLFKHNSHDGTELFLNNLFSRSMLPVIQHGLAPTPLKLTIYVLINKNALQFLEYLSKIFQITFRFFTAQIIWLEKIGPKYITSESRSVSPEKLSVLKSE